MAINFTLAPVRDVDADVDPMRRTWTGWDPARSAAELWEANRGIWPLSDERLVGQRYATLSFEGCVQVVALIDGVEVHVAGTSPMKALTGQVLTADHPVALALLGRPVPEGDDAVVTLETEDVERAAAAPTAPVLRAAADAPRAGFLLTYDPDRWEWSEGGVLAAAEATAHGRLYKAQWSTGSRSAGITPGDRAFLLRQGAGPRGVVASGVFRSGVVELPGGERPGERHHALVDWDTVLGAEDVLPLEVLQARVPAGAWTPMESGLQVSPDALVGLEALWAEHRTSTVVADRARAGRGREPAPARRRAVEDAAWERLVRHFVADGWQVEDTRTTQPYDAVATRGPQARYLTATGTQTAADHVLVTEEEIEHARAHPDACVLGVLAGVVLDEAGDAVPGTGHLRVLPWDPDAGTLTPATYRYTPPSP
ncbi:hypothetical protein [Cellulomonas oligotrophica]|uniref:Uncharacterized protein n=1 Tax=Cellulomonas oligotrophica TaxID=931536 RepID=A0A7Y9FIU5_9CELL|nr:hypothetical protein [Cellulomonas oligotrophica]NYD86806.1 hypothetical protein [Cellulomonas oligotrophica]GIG32409.1 hypothetical protein Col01nite_15680 [Cellulomonas oligotrophica]